MRPGGAAVDPGPQPKNKMKSFFWDKVPDNRLGPETVWSKIKMAKVDYEVLDMGFQQVGA